MTFAHDRYTAELNEAYAAVYVGKNILGTDFSVDVVLTWGAGAYIVGEETGLIESLEGNRGMPRLKPPHFPAAIGLYQKPTIVNDVETLSNPPWIARHCGDAFAALGAQTSKCMRCREGTSWLEKILSRIIEGEGRPEDVDLLLDVCDNISPGISWPPRQTTICPLGPSVVSPIASAVGRFRHEFEAYIGGPVETSVAMTGLAYHAPEAMPSG